MGRDVQTPRKLLVFSDDWGRHPSSCQHLIGAMLPRVRVTWVNTIGMRPPRLDLLTLKRGAEKIGGWLRPHKSEGLGGSEITVPAGLSVIDAKMWPWMSRRWDRWLNTRLLTHQLDLFARDAVAITTIPIVTDFAEKLPVDSWVYYCVDDFSVWPGLDSSALGQMEDELLPKVDTIIAASDSLAEGIRRRGYSAEVLTHGVDIDFWRCKDEAESGDRELNLSQPLILFWGVVDRRMNSDWVLELAEHAEDCRIVLLGPQQDPDPRLQQHPRIEMPGRVAFDELPAWAARASALIMPYADQAVTRAMQPLKLKEYLATGKPVVVSALPAVRGWEPHLHVAESADQFVEQTLLAVRAESSPGVGDPLLAEKLQRESWDAKARDFISMAIPGIL